MGPSCLQGLMTAFGVTAVTAVQVDGERYCICMLHLASEALEAGVRSSWMGIGKACGGRVPRCNRWWSSGL